MKSEMLMKLHEGHLDINKCKQRADQSLWWLGIGRDLQQYVSQCQSTRSTQHKEPLKTTPLPDRPWQRIAADLCEIKGDKYLIMIDYFSRFIEIMKMNSTTSEQIVLKLKTLFARFVIPEVLISDNGPQFACVNRQEFASACDFHHITTSPHSLKPMVRQNLEYR